MTSDGSVVAAAAAGLDAKGKLATTADHHRLGSGDRTRDASERPFSGHLNSHWRLTPACSLSGKRTGR